MSLSRLAILNIKRNSTKYIMYFFSLSFSVFTAYTFLALMQNEYVLMAFKYDDRYQAMLIAFGIIIMVFVMFFLISSNKSFIKARKKEISVYSLLGMTNGKIGRLLFMETITVGLMALVIGIVIGIFFSKLVAMILLDISLASFTGDIKFTIDPLAIYITCAVFLLIFCVMGLTGLRVVNKFELVDLFKADKMSEGNSKGSTIVLVLSLILIGLGYMLAINNNVEVVVKSAITILVLVITGTYLFFWNGLPKVLNIIKRNKSSYYKGANLISISALSHRMKSIGSVMATIAVLSAVATTAIATGFTLYSNIEKNTYDTIGYDMFYYTEQDNVFDNIMSVFDKNDIKNLEKYSVDLYQATPQTEPIVINEYQFINEQEYFRVYSQTGYNNLMSLSKTDLMPVNIQSGEVMYLYPYTTEEIEKSITGIMLNFPKQSLKVSSVLRTGIVSFGARHTLVLNDGDFNELLQSGDILSANNNTKIFNYEKALKSGSLNAELRQVLAGNVGSYRTAYDQYNESLMVFGLICFIGFFMSIVFILMTASLLYFKQIMAAEEERHQYKMLRKIGMDSLVEKRVIVKRLIFVFFIPLLIGIVHSIFAMKTADTIVFSNMIPVENSYLTVLAFSGIMYLAYSIVYGIFYLITKRQYSRIIK